METVDKKILLKQLKKALFSTWRILIHEKDIENYKENKKDFKWIASIWKSGDKLYILNVKDNLDLLQKYSTKAEIDKKTKEIDIVNSVINELEKDADKININKIKELNNIGIYALSFEVADTMKYINKNY